MAEHNAFFITQKVIRRQHAMPSLGIIKSIAKQNQLFPDLWMPDQPLTIKR
jgi:hypothetical protein